ncbi:MAG TPA: efflux RND transporter periplasmic adaptor subunit [Planctomycetota bacterium]|jgi:HlyD family secretion protein|nr:efflux RND transporter periplasmic adaptor subunit [Planctomycetota bacterium]
MKSGGILASKGLWLCCGVVAVATGLWLAPARWFGKEPPAEVQGARVRRGPLRISVLQRGELSAKNSVSVKSEIEGQTTILQLVTEGTIVKPGDLLVRLDSSDLVEKELQQRIAADNADAAYKKAKAQYDIQISQNQSDIEAAERKSLFAATDLEKYRKGDLEQLRKANEDKILLAQQKRTQAENTLTWSKTLHEKGFLTQTELDRDDLDFQSADVQWKQADLAKQLFTDYEDPRKQAQLEADLQEARRGLDRAKLQADARIADYQAALTTTEARLKLENDKLTKYRDQLAKTRLTSTTTGMVVYSRSEGGRMGMGEAMQEGSQVREGQEILTIPAQGGMIAQASIHESVLNQVAKGLACTINVDAIPGAEFHGSVHFVALLPDKGNWWANPNQRLYRTEVSIDDATQELRPGMNCGIEILVEEIPDTLYAPIQSVMLSRGETIAFVVVGGRPEERKVQVGKQSDKWVQILSGLSEDEEVLLAPPPGFTPQKKTEEPGAHREGAPETPANADPAKQGPRAGGDGAKNRDGRMRKGGGPRPGGGAPSKEGAGGEAAVPPAANAETGKADTDKAAPAAVGGGGGTRNP